MNECKQNAFDLQRDGHVADLLVPFAYYTNIELLVYKMKTFLYFFFNAFGDHVYQKRFYLKVINMKLNEICQERFPITKPILILIFIEIRNMILKKNF